MLVLMKDMFQYVLWDGYVVGQFNINNLEWVGVVLSIVQQCCLLVILGVFGGMVKYMFGLKCIYDIVVNVMEYLYIDVLVVLYLDYGIFWEVCEVVIVVGFSFIMFDGLYLLFRENLVIICYLVMLVYSKGIFVEVELGIIVGSEDGIVNFEVIYVDFQECYILVIEIQVDCFVVVLGFIYGLYKGKV